MTLTKILEALQYNKPMTIKGEPVAMVAISELAAIRADQENIRLFVTMKTGEQQTILSGDLEMGA